MRRFLTIAMAAVVVVALSFAVFAQTATQTTSSGKKIEAAGLLSTTGKVDKVDKSTRTFTVKTKDGDKEFTLASDAKITAGAKTEKVTDLPNKTVKVTYKVVDGRNVASKVTIASEQKPEARMEGNENKK
jgi:hypothetical protein